VDKIVPGKPSMEEQEFIDSSQGFIDAYSVKAEPYSLWAIEGVGLEEDLGFLKSNDTGVVLSANIEKYRELKLRLLNAPHTLLSGLCFLSGHSIVNQSLKDETIHKYLENLFLTECIPAISLKSLDVKIKQRYMREVIDRFSNPYIDHYWSSILVQYSLKFKSRIIPLIENYIDSYDSLPFYLLRCFAAYFVYMKTEKIENGRYYGSFEGNSYEIKCDKVAEFNQILQETGNDLKSAIKRVLTEIMDSAKLSKNEALIENASNFIRSIEIFGMKETIASLNVYA
jgi:tagaturonate reductase